MQNKIVSHNVALIIDVTNQRWRVNYDKLSLFVEDTHGKFYLEKKTTNREDWKSMTACQCQAVDIPTSRRKGVLQRKTRYINSTRKALGAYAREQGGSYAVYQILEN